MIRVNWSPSLPVAIALAIGPVAGVLQSKALAPIAVAALLLAVLAHRRQRGAWPWPRGAAAWLGLGLFAWGAVTAFWAIEPWRALGTSLQIGGFIALGATAARAVAADDDAAHRRLLLTATGGLAAGILLAGLDAVTGNAIRAAVRGLKEIPPTLAFGLKPAASAMALWLPLVAAAPLPRLLRAGVIGAGAVVLVLLPGEAAKLAVLAGLLIGGLALLLPRLARPGLGAVLAAAVIAMPMLLGPILARGLPAADIPPSAAHRLLIWDFVIGRIAEQPLLGWGMEASRSVPGHREHPTPEALARFGLDGPQSPPWLAAAELLPLHPHNGALQLRLELGWPGVLLAAALAVALAMACGSPVALAMLAAGAVTAMLSFGAWQEWWVGAELLAVAAAAALRRPA
ncbi:O-antigen ligase family protein [Belnapia moabensis]|uniref:O-antigen ligase family protein n=1 Tax=Belnapia moabensis TaxID=365533 RepID=UPI0005BADCB1|nr:O-antigen ligase family protein [Belnapia moabensis]